MSSPRDALARHACLLLVVAACSTQSGSGSPGAQLTAGTSGIAAGSNGAAGSSSAQAGSAQAGSAGTALPELDAAVPPDPADAAASGGAGAAGSLGGAGAPQAGRSADASLPEPADAAAAGSSASDAAMPEGSTSYAAELDGLLLDVLCDAATPTPLARMATCLHPSGMQRMTKLVTFGGDPSMTYVVTLRVRGIWEPTSVQGGERPSADAPFTIGGAVPAGSSSSDAINYQQYSIVVAEPKQTYWLNDHKYVAHDIHKVDYQATITVTGGSSVTVSMSDGNERQIANWTNDYFEGVEPHATTPSLGQTLHLDVMSVTPKR
jgi:hypothetical protein